MAKVQHRAKELVEQAIKETGSTKIEVVSEKLEQYMRSRVEKRSVVRECRVWSELKRLGIATTGDIKSLVDEIKKEQEPKEEKPIARTTFRTAARAKGWLFGSLGGGQAEGTWGELCSAGKYVGREEVRG